MSKLSVKKGRDEKSIPAPRQTLEPPSSSTPQLTAPSFPFALEMILLTEKAAGTKLIDIASKRAIRLTCKAARSVIDAHYSKVSYAPSWPEVLVTDLSRWPNISELDLQYGDRVRTLKEEDVKNLVKLSLPKLRTLKFDCDNLLQLAQSNWPMLENLYLYTYGRPEGPKAAPYATYPKDFKLPKWSLKSLDVSIDNWHNVDFLPALLKNCAELTYLRFYGTRVEGKTTSKVATMIASTPLKQLEEMNLSVWGTLDLRLDFYRKLFQREWPAMKKLTCTEGRILPLIASKKWFTNVEYLDLSLNEHFTGDELHSALKSLERSNKIKTLILSRLYCDVLEEGFRGIQLHRLEILQLLELDSENWDEDTVINISDSLNVLFESCETAAFPALVELCICHDIQQDEDGSSWPYPEWNRAPTKRLIEQCPLLKKIELDGLDIGGEVMKYLGNFRKEGGSIDTGDSSLGVSDMSPDCREFLQKLGISRGVCESFCQQEGCEDDFLDCFFYNIISEERFRLISYAAALNAATDAPKLKNFLDLIESDFESSGMSVSGFQWLKSFLEQAVEAEKDLLTLAGQHQSRKLLHFGLILYLDCIPLSYCTMPKRSVKKGEDEESTCAQMQTMEPPSSSSAPQPAAQSFSFVLEIILLTEKAAETKLIDIASKKAIRLTCKAARSLIDGHVLVVSFDRGPSKALSDLSPWPWPNLSELDLIFKDRGNILKDEDVYNLVELSLPQLRTLKFDSCNFVPLAQSNWPMLENLHVGTYRTKGKPATYPKDFKLPKWTLKKLGVSINDWQNVDFLPPLLKNCAELTYLEFHEMNALGGAPAEVAAMVTSAPLNYLEEMKLHVREARNGFYPKLFKREWPALKKLTCTDGRILPLIVSKKWFTNVEYLELQGSVANITSEQLSRALKSLEKIKTLILSRLKCPVLAEGFRGIKLEHLETLQLLDLVSLFWEEDNVINISDSLNVLFDSCETAAFPALVELRIFHEIQEEDDDDDYGGYWHSPEWDRAPTKRLVAQCPSLKKIFLNGLSIGQEVMHYLGDFRKGTGGRIDVGRSALAVLPMSPNLLEFLSKLGIGYDVWNSFCQQEGCDDDYRDCFFWNILPEERFRLISYAAALNAATDAPKLKNFLDLIESDFESSGMSVSGFQSLKSFLEQVASQGETMGIEKQTWKWKDIGKFIDFKSKSDV